MPAQDHRPAGPRQLGPARALKRVYAALEANGIAFASGAVTVKAPDSDRLVPSPAADAAATVPVRATRLAGITG
jgi:hypothetical protein